MKVYTGIPEGSLVFCINLESTRGKDTIHLAAAAASCSFFFLLHKVGGILGITILVAVSVTDILLSKDSWNLDLSIVTASAVLSSAGYLGGFLLALLTCQSWPRYLGNSGYSLILRRTWWHLGKDRRWLNLREQRKILLYLVFCNKKTRYV